MSNQNPRQRKAQTGEPTGNGGHFGSRTRPDGALTDMDLERLKDANSFGGTEEFEQVRAGLDAKAEDAAERASEAYRNGWDDEELFCHECGGVMTVDENEVSNHVLDGGQIDHDTDADHVAYGAGSEDDESNTVFTFDGDDGQEFTVDDAGDGQYSVYGEDGNLVISFSHTGDSEDHNSIEDAARTAMSHQ